VAWTPYKQTQVMLNTGSTPLPYEPYGYQEGWEVRDNQDRLIWGREDELQTDTGSLQLKGYELPVKVKSILGDTVQNGTPSPSPVNPNLVDPSKTVSGYQNNNGTIHTPTNKNERTTDWIPFTTDKLYAIVSGSNGGNINWVLYNSNKEPLYFYGPTFTPNTVIIISRSGYSAAAFIRISWTNAINQPICVTTEQRSEYIPFDPNPPGPIIPEMCGVRTGNLIEYPYNTHDGLISGIAWTTTMHNIKGSGTTTSGTNFYFFRNKVIKAGTYKITVSGKHQGMSLLLWNSASSTMLANLNPSTNTATLTLESDMPSCHLYFNQASANVSVDIDCTIMFNSGQTALPYEPYGWKIPIENHEENLISLPTITAESDGLTVSSSSESMTLFGNITRIYEDNPIWKKFDFTLDAGEYTLSLGKPRTYQNGYAPRLHKYDDGSVLTSYLINSVTFTLSEKTHVYMAFYIDDKQLYDDKWVFRLRKGSTVNEVKPIYLSEVPTIRRIKCVDLGTLTYTKTGSGNFSAALGDGKVVDNSQIAPAICSHFKVVSANNYSSTPYSLCASINLQSFVNINKAGYEEMTATEFKSAMSGVLLWYALANPETGIVNEPLAKIGNYADELTEVSVHNLSAPLYGIGDYKDILNLSTGVLTRNIRKLVLNGTENWSVAYENVYLSDTGMKSGKFQDGVCTHVETGTRARYGTMIFGWSDSAIYLIGAIDIFGSLDNFKSFLADQYDAGTPVTIWYILEAPETETVTVPTGMTGEIEGYLTQISTPNPEHPSIPKWNGKEETGGTYAVTVYTPPEIPITTGKNTLTVETEKIHGLTNPLCGIGNYKDVLNLSTGVVTRNVKKFVWDGTERWELYESATNRFFYVPLPANAIPSPINTICTHYGGNLTIPSQGTTIRFPDRDSTWTTTADFKAFLAAQYANGTPVTIWYVLETPETETIAVPYGLECSVEGYLTQSGTPTPSNPITPESNGILESDGTYTIEASLVPSSLVAKGHARKQDITKVHYGFKINKSTENSNNAVSYMYDAATMTPAHMDYEKDEFNYGSWENAFFVKDCYPVALNLDGTEAYKLDPNDYTKKLNGE